MLVPPALGDGLYPFRSAGPAIRVSWAAQVTSTMVWASIGEAMALPGAVITAWFPGSGLRICSTSL